MCATTDKRAILVIHHSERDGTQLRDSIAGLVLTSGEILGGRYDLVLRLVHGEWTNDNLRSVAREISLECHSERWPCLILVDLVMIHGGATDEPTGVALANALRGEFPGVPVAVFTSVRWTPKSLYEASVAPGVDAMLDLSDPLAELGRLSQLIENGERALRRRMQASIRSILSAPAHWILDWSDKQGATEVYCRAVQALSWHIFCEHSDIERLELRVLTPGFSGASLVRATARDSRGHELPQRWVMKVAEHEEDIEKLVSELKGYRIMYERTPHHYLPLLYPSTVDRPQMLLPTWWAAFAMSFEEDVWPLLDLFYSSTMNARTVYEGVFGRCLAQLYGTIDKVKFASDIVAEKHCKSASESLDEIARWRVAVSRHYGGFDDDLASVGRAVGDLRTLCRKLNKVYRNGKSAKFVHGDLNCRNIMVDADGAVFKVIDFPKVASEEPRPVATDFAKAELELLMIIMDRKDGLDVDPARLPMWVALFEALCARLEVGSVDLGTNELDRVVECCQQVRQSYMSMAGNDESDWNQYRVVLIHYLLQYLTYHDLTPVKRCAVVAYARRVIESL